MEMATASGGTAAPVSVAPWRRCALHRYATAAFGQGQGPRVGGEPFGADGQVADASGFDKFYGFIGGEANQWAPALYDGMTGWKRERPGIYHL
jgi:arylsulfatase